MTEDAAKSLAEAKDGIGHTAGTGNSPRRWQAVVMRIGPTAKSRYFDWVYTPVYDLTVGKMPVYSRFQSTALQRLSTKDCCATLSVGVGTGNELVSMLQRRGPTSGSLAAVDFSRRSLAIARRKAHRHGKLVDVVQMDAECLAFTNESFDRVVCLHTMDFLKDPVAATREIVRVLKKGGELVVTYPSGEGISALAHAATKSVLGKVRHANLVGAFSEALASLGAGVFYAPLALLNRPHRLVYSRLTLEGLLSSLPITRYDISEDPIYKDFLVWGSK